MKNLTLISSCCFLFMMQPIVAQNIENEQKAEVLKNLISELKNSYIDESKAVEMADHLNENIWNGNYDSIQSATEFAFVLTQDLRSISNDLHLEVLYSDSPLQAESNEEAWLKDLLENNGYGVRQKKILEGNIGYLEIPFFGPITHCADSLFEAMKFISETDALILDLRECRGSLDPDMIPFFSGYFFDQPVHLFDFENRKKNTLRQMWSAAYVPGPKYLDKPLFILTSGRTFSGGEEFAYDMKHLGRAKLLGQVTKGGANPKYPVQLSENFLVTIPMERSVNSVTGTNWEAVGVQPDVEMHAALTLHQSQVMILEELLANEKNPEKASQLNQNLEKIKETIPELTRVKIFLTGYPEAKKVLVSGTFNYWATNTNFLQKTDQGWQGFVEVFPGEHRYQLVIDGRWVPDPTNPNQVKEGNRIYSFLKVD